MLESGLESWSPGRMWEQRTESDAGFKILQNNFNLKHEMPQASSCSRDIEFDGEPGHLLTFQSNKYDTSSTSIRMRHFVFAPLFVNSSTSCEKSGHKSSPITWKREHWAEFYCRNVGTKIQEKPQKFYGAKTVSKIFIPWSL